MNFKLKWQFIKSTGCGLHFRWSGFRVTEPDISKWLLHGDEAENIPRGPEGFPKPSASGGAEYDTLRNGLGVYRGIVEGYHVRNDVELRGVLTASQKSVY